MDLVDLEVHDVADRHRYEARTGANAVAGFIAYRDVGGVRDLLHTVVGEEFEGKGVGSALARWALDDARARGLKVRATCPFVAGWLERHQDHADVIVP